jgi:hypothetical protein
MDKIIINLSKYPETLLGLLNCLYDTCNKLNLDYESHRQELVRCITYKEALNSFIQSFDKYHIDTYYDEILNI